MRRLALIPVVAGAAGCPLHPIPTTQSHDDRPRLVASERGPSGGRLVMVSEDGKRQSVIADAVAVSPVFSPDGRWIAFASPDEAGLHIHLEVVAATPGATPVAIDTGDARDVTPAWTPDGGALVFASQRGGDLDLWRIELDTTGATPKGKGAPVRLTDREGQEFSPSVAADGRIAFTAVDAGGAFHSHIAVRAADGRITDVTTGPADSGPAWTPDGRAIVFTAPHLRSGSFTGVDGDLWRVGVGGGTPVLVADVPDTDEAGPVWSSDGRWLFASSTFRALSSGSVLFSSIVIIDARDPKAPVRMLFDPSAGDVPRLAIAVAPGALDDAALAAEPHYRDTLTEILERAAKANARNQKTPDQ